MSTRNSLSKLIQDLAVEMRAGFADLHQRFDHLETKMELRFQGVDKRFDGVGSQLKDLDRQVKDLDRQVKDVVAVTHLIYDEHGARLKDLEEAAKRRV